MRCHRPTWPPRVAVPAFDDDALRSGGGGGALAFVVRYLIFGDLQNRVVFTFFVPAAMVAVWYGGLGPGMLATVLGLFLGDFFFMPPRNPIWPVGLGIRQSMGVAAYAVTTMLCVMLCERLHGQIRRFEHALEHERHHPSPAPHPEAQASGFAAWRAFETGLAVSAAGRAALRRRRRHGDRGVRIALLAVRHAGSTASRFFSSCRRR